MLFAAQRMHDCPQLQDDELGQLLLLHGAPRHVAARAPALLPIACVRLLLPEVQYRDEIEVLSHGHTRRQVRRLDAEPVFIKALELAREVEQADGTEETRLSKEVFVSVAQRSAEFNAINKALHQGSDQGTNLSDLQTTRSMVTYALEEDDPNERAAGTPSSTQVAPETPANGDPGLLSKLWHKVRGPRK